MISSEKKDKPNGFAASVLFNISEIDVFIIIYIYDFNRILLLDVVERGQE